MSPPNSVCSSTTPRPEPGRRPTAADTCAARAEGRPPRGGLATPFLWSCPKKREWRPKEKRPGCGKEADALRASLTEVSVGEARFFASKRSLADRALLPAVAALPCKLSTRQRRERSEARLRLEAMGCARSTERLPTVGRAAQLPAAVGRLWSLRGFFWQDQKKSLRNGLQGPSSLHSPACGRAAGKCLQAQPGGLYTAAAA